MKGVQRGVNAHGVVLLLVVVVLLQKAVLGRPLQLQQLTAVTRPSPKDTAAFARWLVCQSSWGVLRNVVSFSDGQPDKGSGIPYFYLTTLDPTARYALKDQRSSFTISEHPIGTCGTKDPENPSCAKITLVGKLTLLDGNSKEAELAQTALFTKHPEMTGWPKGHNFQFFELEIYDIFMINWFGGPKPLTVEQYLQADMNKVTFSF